MRNWPPFSTAVNSAVCLLSLILVAGCGQSKEEAVLEKAASASAPGFVRLLNLTGDTYKLLDGQRPMASNITGGQASTPAPLGAKSKSVGVQKDGGSVISVPVAITSGEVTLVVLFPDGKTTAVVEKGLRKPAGSENATVTFLDQSGAPAQPATDIKLDSGGQSIALDKPSLELMPGSYKLSGGSLSEPVEFSVDQKYAYSLVFIGKGSGKFEGFALVNSDTSRPAASGQSGA